MAGSASIMARAFAFVITLGNASRVINVDICTYVRYLMPKESFAALSIQRRITRSHLTDRFQNQIQLLSVNVSQLVSSICLLEQGPQFFPALHKKSYDCIEPIDKINGASHDILDDSVFEAVLRLVSSTLVSISLAAPYCSKHRRATPFPGGPQPVRTPQEPEGCAANTLQQDIALQESAAVHDRSRIVSDLVMVHGGISALENPIRSMTWLDPAMSEWVHQQTPFVSVCSACQFGADWDKSWLFVCNHSCIHQIAAVCPHPKRSHKQVAGVKLADGSFFSRLTAAYPDALADALAKCFAPHLTKEGVVIRLSDWIQSLPRQPTWQFAVSQGRIEDGGSLASTARWASPQHTDVLQLLRGRWQKQLMGDGLAHRLACSLRDGNPEL